MTLVVLFLYDFYSGTVTIKYSGAPLCLLFDQISETRGEDPFYLLRGSGEERGVGERAFTPSVPWYHGWTKGLK